MKDGCDLLQINCQQYYITNIFNTCVRRCYTRDHGKIIASSGIFQYVYIFNKNTQHILRYYVIICTRFLKTKNMLSQHRRAVVLE